MNACVLEKTKNCTACGECDICDMNPLKLCDNCCKCIDGGESVDFAKIPVSKVMVENDN